MKADAASGSSKVSARWSQLTFGVKINFILGFGLALLAAASALAYRSVGILVDSGRLEGAALAEEGRLEATVSSVWEAESAQRKYVITADPADLVQYRAAREDVSAELGVLGSQTSDPIQRRRLGALEEVVSERIARLDRGVQIRQAQGAAAVAAFMRSAEADRLNREIERIAGEYRQHEFRALGVRRADTAASADLESFLVFWVASLAFALLVWAMIYIHRHQTSLRAAEGALKASEQELRLITDSVPALISYVDIDGRLQFHNKAFEQWFGRTSEAFQGHALRELIGQKAWQTVGPHIEAVLRGDSVAFEFEIPWEHVRARDAAVRLVPRRNEAGEVTGYYSLVTDITAFKEVDRLKSEFVWTVSHELRTPLTSIRGSLGLLAGGVAGALPEKVRELVAIATDNCERLVRLVNDILDSEKMLSGKLEMSLEDLDLEEVVGRSIRQNEGYAASHGVRIRLECAVPRVRVRADADRLAQVITNLLSNASKFSPRGGEIEVCLDAADCVAKVSVSDRGPGVPEEFRARLFERFAQAETYRQSTAGGTGLGLSICKGIIERLGGKIGYAPREGGGSVFHFELPALSEAEA